MAHAMSKPIAIIAATAVVSLGVAGYVWREEQRPPILEVYVFALKSGRSMFIRTPEDRRILVDGGSNSEIIREITDILPFYSRRIDAVIATNSDGKNVSGLIDAINRYDVSRVYIPAMSVESLGLASSTDDIYSTFLETIRAKNIPVQELKAGTSIDLDSRTRMDILFPILDWHSLLNSASTSISSLISLSPLFTPSNKIIQTFQYSAASAPEVLFRLSFGANSMVFLGNASVKVQKLIAATSLDSLKSDVLIVSHSALPANMAQTLVDSISPNYLVFSKELNVTSKLKTSTKTSSSTKKTKIPPDPLASIPGDNRFNLKEKGTVKIWSDEVQVIITTND
jgi:competence protein ComEC